MATSTPTITRPALLLRLAANVIDALPGLGPTAVMVQPSGGVTLQPVNHRDEADVADVDRIAAYLGLPPAKIKDHCDDSPQYGTEGTSAGVSFDVRTVLTKVPAVAA
jgi:hypothetical protein